SDLEFATADVALVIGANDVVNPVARTDPSSPIYGMPILNADKARNVIVIKRGQGAGFSGIENGLFFLDQTRMLYGDGQAMASELIQAVKSLSRSRTVDEPRNRFESRDQRAVVTVVRLPAADGRQHRFEAGQSPARAVRAKDADRHAARG